MFEVWQPVRGYEGIYKVSDQGRVKGLKGLIKPKPTNSGYLRTELWQRGTRWRPSIHRLVADHFIPNPRQCPQVNHKDGNKANNAVSNLEWCTASENMIHAVRLQGRYGEGATGSKLTEQDVTAIQVMLGKGVPGAWLADVFGVTNAQISNIRNRQQWQHLNNSKPPVAAPP